MDANAHGRMGQDTKSPTQVAIHVDAHGRMGQETKSPTQTALGVYADGRTGRGTKSPTHVVANTKQGQGQTPTLNCKFRKQTTTTTVMA